jgi:hypothetical protein
MTFETDFERSMDEQSWSPPGGTSLERYREIHAEVDTAWRQALQELVDAEPGLNGRWVTTHDNGKLIAGGTIGNAPWLSWDDDPRGGYYVAHGLEHQMYSAENNLFGWTWVHYLRDAVDDESHDRNEYPLNKILFTEPEDRRHVRLHAALAIAAIRVHKESLDGH